MCCLCKYNLNSSEELLVKIISSRSRLLSHDSPNRKRGVLKRAPIDKGWYGKKAFRVTLTTWKVERHWVLRTKAVNGYDNYRSR